jgi:conjugative transposon TraK protein
MFPTFKNLDHAFRQLRRISVGCIAASLLTTAFALTASYRYAVSLQNRVYVLMDGKALEAFSTDRGENLPAEARDHIRTFHALLFGMDPDEKLISANASRALYLADRSGKQVYDNLRESGYVYGIVSGNISQRVEVDSVTLDLASRPYRFRCYARELITRTSTVTTRVLVTEGCLRPVSRSDNNPHGFLIERFSILDNHDVGVENRGYGK